MASDVMEPDNWSALTGELRRRLGPGSPLEPQVRGHFEGRLGGDLSGAMVHRSPLGGYLARALGAQAFTAGQHVVGDAQMDPSTRGGAALLGHELTHTLQRDISQATEASALNVERLVSAEHDHDGDFELAHSVDIDALADRVYRLLRHQLLLERDRAAWVV